MNLKLARLNEIKPLPTFQFIEIDLVVRDGIAVLFIDQQFDKVIHLAAQAGVGYFIDNPMAYADSNLIGHLTILEGWRHNKVKHLVYASLSSVHRLDLKELKLK